MRRALPAILAVGLACCAGVAGAEPLAIPLPGLTGDYDGGFVAPIDAPRLRTVTFTTPSEVATIDRLQVVMAGTYAEGAMICERSIGGFVYRDTLVPGATLRLVLTAATLGTDCFFGAVGMAAPAFAGASSDVRSCDPVSPLDPDLLLGATVQAELECGSAPPCEPWIDALVTLAEVTLVVDGQVVPAAATTWGEIRALYR